MNGKVHTNLQRAVLTTYAKFLRVAAPLDPSIKQQIISEFREGAKKFKSTEILQIEYVLRRADRQLQQLKTGNIVKASSFKMKHTN